MKWLTPDEDSGLGIEADTRSRCGSPAVEGQRRGLQPTNPDHDRLIKFAVLWRHKNGQFASLATPVLEWIQ